MIQDRLTYLCYHLLHEHPELLKEAMVFTPSMLANNASLFAEARKVADELTASYCETV